MDLGSIFIGLVMAILLLLFYISSLHHEAPRALPISHYEVPRAESYHNAHHGSLGFFATGSRNLSNNQREKAESYHNAHHGSLGFFATGSRNLSNNQREKAIPTLDLHEYTVPEAIQATNDFLNENRYRENSVRIVTGRGLHSTDGVAKIKPAIIGLLDKRHLKYEKISKGGCLEVYL